MLWYEKIDVSEGIDVNKTSSSKNVSFVTIDFLKMLDLNLKNMFVINVNDLLTMAYSLKNITILSAKGTIFRCLLMGISKNEGLKIVTHDREVL